MHQSLFFSEVLDPQSTLLEQLQRDFPLETQPTLRKLLGAFQFPGGDVDKKIAALSGGEKTRLVSRVRSHDNIRAMYSLGGEAWPITPDRSS